MACVSVQVASMSASSAPFFLNTPATFCFIPRRPATLFSSITLSPLSSSLHWTTSAALRSLKLYALCFDFFGGLVGGLVGSLALVTAGAFDLGLAPLGTASTEALGGGDRSCKADWVIAPRACCTASAVGPAVAASRASSTLDASRHGRARFVPSVYAPPPSASKRMAAT